MGNKRKKRKSNRSSETGAVDEDSFERPLEELTDYEKIQREFLRQKAINAHFSKPGPLPFIIVLDHLKANFNIGKIFRSTEVFGGAAVYVVGTKEFNPYPAKGGFRHVPAKFFSTFQECFEALTAQGYTLYVLEPDAAEFLGEVDLEKKSAFVIGHEMNGITFKKEDFVGLVSVKIRQIGQTQSLNAAVAGSVAMFEYSRQHAASILQSLTEG